MVTAVIKKRKDICVKKYLSLCKVSDVSVVYINDNNMCVSGTLQAVNTIHSLLEVCHLVDILKLLIGNTAVPSLIGSS